ncbi:type I-E CRISPR-associated protein Cse1/CasA [Streptomyces sp. NPDC088261]|uniref:type I-E CRISPR-associated protein Cse1/CasA n=1 Tax=Streptomyces sp. NPDC088261 TaxID=3365851 RepID=UPI00382EA1D3
MPETTELSEAEAGLSFDLTDRPWVPVQWLDRTEDELSLSEVFTQAARLRRLAGDLPTQEFALLRLLLAVAHDAFDGPRTIDDWADLWADPDCFATVPAYLARHRQRFDLLHPTAPFFQVVGLHTAKGEVFSLNRIVADVPNGEPFFTSRMPDVARLGFAEATRWVVHAHAYDTSGIKTGVEGDDRVKGGKVYPQGVGWAGTLGGVFAEGNDLRETLLLNLIAADTSGIRFGQGDMPAWRREPCGPGATGRLRPSGVRDLYTWQTRRLRLHFKADGVHGVVLGYGDPLTPHNMHSYEPMTGWRRSPAQEKKRGEPVVYLPQEHDPARSAWRGLAALISNPITGAQSAEAAARLRPGVFEWIARLVTEGELDKGFLIRARVVGPVYGTQQSVIDEVVNDHLSMGVVLLHQRDREYAQQAIDAVADAEAAVRTLGDLASDLARAVGADPDPAKDIARDLGFGALDGLYPIWLRELTDEADPYEYRTVWQRRVYRCVIGLGERLLTHAGDAAWEGRTVESKTGTEWLNSALADGWFRSRLSKALGDPFPTAPPTDEPAGPPSGTHPAGPDFSPKVPA